MKHMKKIYTFGSSKAQRDAAIKNMANDLLMHEYIKTTKAKALAVRTFVDKLLSRFESGLNGERYLVSKLGDKRTIKKVIDVLIPRYKNDNFGFVQTYKLNTRPGDGAQMYKLILKGYKPTEKSKLKKVKGDQAKEETEGVEKKTKKPFGLNLSKSKTEKKAQVSNVVDKSKAKSRSGI